MSLAILNVCCPLKIPPAPLWQNTPHFFFLLHVMSWADYICTTTSLTVFVSYFMSGYLKLSWALLSLAKKPNAYLRWIGTCGGSGKGPTTPVEKCQTTLQATRAECGSDWLHSSWLAVGDADPSQRHIFYLPNGKTLSVTCATSHGASPGV